MSIDVEDLGVKFEVPAGLQRLPEMRLDVCQCCHSRVYFRARSSKPTSDPHFKLEYLYCPVCGATATQIREVEVLERRVSSKPKIRYLYEC